MESKEILASKLKPGDQFLRHFKSDDNTPMQTCVVTVVGIEKVGRLYFSRGPAWRIFVKQDVPFWAKSPLLVWPDTRIKRIEQ